MRDLHHLPQLLSPNFHDLIATENQQL
jgi:hypothetical protein